MLKTPILAGCPLFICKKCGNPREKVYRKLESVNVPAIGGKKHLKNGNKTYSGNKSHYIKEFAGYSDCGCNSEFSPGIVFDPFLGSGTTGIVSLKLGRNFVGCELNPDYIKIAKNRLKPFMNIKLDEFMVQPKILQ